MAPSRYDCPAGETLANVRARADRMIGRIRSFLRILAVRWLRLPAIEAYHFVLTIASPSILGYDHGLDQPAICLWSDDRHLAGEYIPARGACW